jgi:hypothetical protein
MIYYLIQIKKILIHFRSNQIGSQFLLELDQIELDLHITELDLIQKIKKILRKHFFIKLTIKKCFTTFLLKLLKKCCKTFFH